jgi:transcriptional regulator with XRE-family HTH domain
MRRHRLASDTEMKMLRGLVGERIREAMATEPALTIKDWAHVLGLPYGTLCHIRQGLVMPSALRLVELADVFDVSVDWLLGRTNKRCVASDLAEGPKE